MPPNPIRPFLRNALYSFSSCSRAILVHPPQPQPQPQPHEPILKISRNSCFQTAQHRNYISEMRKLAFEGNIIRLLRNEIQYELERSPPTQPDAKFDSFTVDDRPGEQWITLKRKFGDEDIKLEVTMFNGAVPTSKSGGSGSLGNEVQLYILLIVNISKGHDVLEIACSAWPDSIEINRLLARHGDKTPARPYTGPEFKELDDELQDSLYEFLEARGINGELAVFLHKYIKNKDKTEFLGWMRSVKSSIETQVK